MDELAEQEWSIHKGDCIPHMFNDMEGQLVDFAVFSPPFPSLYAYTSEACDIGNTDTMGAEAEVHLSFFYRGLRKVLKPGRVAMVHVCQIPRMKRSGGVGLCDFRGINIRIAERAGLIYEYDWLVRKNPQAQAIRTRSRELQFSGLETDRASQRGTLCDYLIKLRAPGVNAVPIRDWDVEIDEVTEEITRKVQIHETQVSRNQWIDWAEGAWFDIREADTLNTKEAKGENDTKHICPLQLEVIRRCVKLYSNPGELVFDPFTGIGSSGYVSLSLGRRFHGCEIKDEYHETSCRNLFKVVAETTSQKSLFDMGDDEQ